MNEQMGKNGYRIPVNMLNLFDDEKEEALRQVALDFLTDGAMVIDVRTGNVIASGVTVLDLSRGSKNGGKKTQAASSAARGDGKDPATFSVAIKLSEDDCGLDMDPSLRKVLQVFNGELVDAETGVVEAVKIPIRDLTAPAVADSEFIRLAGDGHVLGVKAFLDSEAGAGRVDEPRDKDVSGCVG